MLSFAAPWLLLTAAALPLLWWLLRILPPAPRRQDFPALRLLLGLTASAPSPARSPLWLVLLRLTLAAALIAAAAHPLWNAAPPLAEGPLLLVVDDGWAAAHSWPQTRDELLRLLDQAERKGRPTRLLTTAVKPELRNGGARAWAETLEPKPWPSDRATAAHLLEGSPAAQVVWLSDGMEDGGSQTLLDGLRKLGPVRVLAPPTSPLLLAPPRPELAELTPVLRRSSNLPSRTLVVRAADAMGRTLARQEVRFEDGDDQKDAPLSMPAELRNRVARIEIEGENSAAATVLLDARWQRHPVGLAEAAPATSPLLDDLYYIERALPQAELRRGKLGDLLQRPLSLLVLPDGAAPPEDAALRRWIEQGGLLLRLAGPKLAAKPDGLLPVALRNGGRSLGGAMSWTQPQSLGPMPDSGPFAGLIVPPDLKVKSQLLAEPSLGLADKTWARLEDGTPLVTAQRLGKGWLVLLHTTVWPSWSDLGLSGLFPQMLDRLLALSQGLGGGSKDEHPLPPWRLMDGFGHLSQQTGLAEPLPVGPIPPPGPGHPPGLYGTPESSRAVNLAPQLEVPEPMSLPAETLGQKQVPEHDLQPPLLLLALALFLMDMAALWGLKRAGMALALGLALALAILLPPTAGQAAAPLLETRLAWVKTGDPAIDGLSRQGLTSLSALVGRRSNAQLAAPTGVDVERDDLAFYPLLYWPVPDKPFPLSALAQERVNDYLRHGGMILFDSRDGGQGPSDSLRLLTQGLEIPPLTPLPPDHVLTRSFYLLKDCPGRLAGGAVYVQQGGEAGHDDVSPVIIGGHDWAGAWAQDSSGAYRYPAVPGGETQREMALRFGVNLVIYALTGSYKADQLHLPAILERLKP